VRLAERDEVEASAAQQPAARLQNSLAAYRRYALAIAIATAQGWPTEVYRPWRFRAATLARYLGSQGRTAEVARTYERILAAYEQ
jgi:hypothetical protein